MNTQLYPHFSTPPVIDRITSFLEDHVQLVLALPVAVTSLSLRSHVLQKHLSLITEHCIANIHEMKIELNGAFDLTAVLVNPCFLRSLSVTWVSKEKTQHCRFPYYGLQSLVSLSLQGIGTYQFRFRSLQELYISDNTEITSLEPFAVLRVLRELHMRHLPSLYNADSSEFSSLRILHIDKCEALKSISLPPELHHLAIKSSPLITALGNVEHCIELTHCAIGNTGIPDEFFERISPNKLQQLGAARSPLIQSASYLKLALRLTHLDLSQTPLRNESVDILAAYPSLLVLDISGCKNITDVSPLQRSRTLEMLNICRTGVTVINPIAEIATLKTLLAAHCRIADTTALQRCKALETLNLNFTHISDSSVTAISTIATLQQVFLSKKSGEVGVRQIKDARALGKCTTLRLVDLRMTGIDDDTIACLSAVRELQELRLDGCRAVTAMHYIALLTNIKVLDISSTSLTTDSLHNLTTLTKLEDLRAMRTESTDVSMLTPLKRLRVLHLDHTPLASCASISLFDGLEELSLNGCSECSDWLELRGCSSLKVLDLSNTNVHTAVAASLCKTLIALKTLLLRQCSYVGLGNSEFFDGVEIEGSCVNVIISGR